MASLPTYNPNAPATAVPEARKNHAVFGSSKYSALATNVTRRRTTSGRKIESENERWYRTATVPSTTRTSGTGPTNRARNSSGIDGSTRMVMREAPCMNSSRPWVASPSGAENSRASSPLWRKAAASGGMEDFDVSLGVSISRQSIMGRAFLEGRTLAVDDVAVAEGHSGTAPLAFTVRLAAPVTHRVTVAWSTADGTATVANGDYQSTSGTLTFNPGQTSQTVMVLVNGDPWLGPNETFFVNLSNPANATIADNQGQGTILNDDPQPPTVSINNVTQAEGNNGTTAFIFTVSLSGTSSHTITLTDSHSGRHGNGRRRRLYLNQRNADFQPGRHVEDDYSQRRGRHEVGA